MKDFKITMITLGLAIGTVVILSGIIFTLG